MPTKGTKARAVRGVPDDKWQAFIAKAEANGETASEVLRRAIDAYLSGPAERKAARHEAALRDAEIYRTQGDAL